jgi:acylphosphatase
MQQRREIRYRGRVQGVGFRYTAQRSARGYAVTGYVRNLPDRSVELVVEGDSVEIESFLQDLADAMTGYIRDTTFQTLPPTGEFPDFGVRH